MMIVEAKRIAREYDEAREAMREAVARFESARREYAALPLSFRVIHPRLGEVVAS